MTQLVSLILVFHNLPEITLQCIQSIHQYTKPHYELLVIDNASTVDMKNAIKAFPRVRFFQNSRNIGYIAALNQGIKKAQGDYYLILNNDIIATPYWLENLLRCMKSDARIGIVGPVTNRIGNPKQTIKTPEFQSPEELMDFARTYNRWDVKKWFPFDHTLAGFCLLIKKEVVETIGLFDERFQLGLCEDYDFVRRAKKAGFRVMCAGDTFIYHYYNLTFKSLQLNRQSLLQKNIQKYKEKWSHKE